MQWQPELTETSADARAHSSRGCVSPKVPSSSSLCRKAGNCRSPLHSHQAAFTDKVPGLLWGLVGFSFSAVLVCGKEEGAICVHNLQVSGHTSARDHLALICLSPHCPTPAQKGKGLLKDLWTHPLWWSAPLHQVLPNIQHTSNLLQ